MRTAASHLLWSQGVGGVNFRKEAVGAQCHRCADRAAPGVIVVSLSAEKKETGSGQKTDVASTGEKQN